MAPYLTSLAANKQLVVMEDEKPDFGETFDSNSSLISTNIGIMDDPSIRLDLSTVWMEKSLIKSAA